MDTEKQAELVRLYIRLQEAADSLHTQATEVYDMARKLEELPEHTTISYAGLRARVEAKATWEQASDLRRELEEMGKEMRGEA